MCFFYLINVLPLYVYDIEFSQCAQFDLGHDIEEAEAMVHQEDAPCKCQSCMQISMAHSARVMERSMHADTELPENVIKIETLDGSKIYVVGTAHFSAASQEDVSQVCT